MRAGRVAGLEHFRKALLLHISELWPLLGWQPFMYLVTLITVKVLMLVRPKSRVKNPSTWRDRERRWWVTFLGIVRFQPSSASLLPFHFHILGFLRFFANLLQTQDFSSDLSSRIRKLKRKLSLRLLFLHNSLIEFHVWGDYLLIMALVKGNYATGLGSRSNCDTTHPAVPFPGDMDQLRSS